MLSGTQAARNVDGGEHDIWAVNVEGEYLEEDRRAVATGRLVPEPVGAIELEEMVRRAFARYDPLALGLSLGTVLGLGLFLARELCEFNNANLSYLPTESGTCFRIAFNRGTN